MLHITGSVKQLEKELRIAHGLIKDIIGVLDNVNSKTNLTESVGTFVVNMYDFKILTKDADSAKRILRMVCTGEMQPGKAAEEFKCASWEIDDLLKMY